MAVLVQHIALMSARVVGLSSKMHELLSIVPMKSAGVRVHQDISKLSMGFHTKQPGTKVGVIPRHSQVRLMLPNHRPELVRCDDGNKRSRKHNVRR